MHPILRAVIAHVDAATADDEAMHAVQAVTTLPGPALALRAHLAGEPFSVIVAIGADGAPTVCADGATPKPAPAKISGLISAIRRCIYETDEAMVEGSYLRPRRAHYSQPPFGPPPGMDIPVWDDERKRWYDAEC